jgi:hypothetical protein
MLTNQPIPVDQDTLTTPLIAGTAEISRDLEALAVRVSALMQAPGFHRQAVPEESGALRLVAAAVRSAAVDVQLIAAALHGRALDAEDCGHGYRVTDSCPGCDREGEDLRTPEQAAALATMFGPEAEDVHCHRCGTRGMLTPGRGLSLECGACGYVEFPTPA